MTIGKVFEDDSCEFSSTNNQVQQTGNGQVTALVEKMGAACLVSYKIGDENLTTLKNLGSIF